jgi:hypothetical protein
MVVQPTLNRQLFSLFDLTESSEKTPTLSANSKFM